MEVNYMIPKFRAWDKEADTMHDVTSIWFDRNNEQYKLGHVSFPSQETVDTIFDNFELMQSTGLKDKNGVEIFEGDIVKVSVHNGFDYYDNEVCVVRKSRFHSGLVCINPNNDMECRIFNQDVLEDYQYEVIGNIYENPELLEVE